MDSLGPNQFDIFEIYRRFRELRIGHAYVCGEEGYQRDEESQRAKFSSDTLNQLLGMVESKMHSRTAIFDELLKLMSQLDLMVDFSEFSCFYDFVFFVCRENGQKNITVSRAVAAWRLVLAGRFRLLNQWCDYVEKNQRHNISEDTWQQVLAFSRCVHENLEGYDPEEIPLFLLSSHCRILGSNKDANLFCCCADTKSQSRAYEDCSPGLRVSPGLKRKLPERHEEEIVSSDSLFSNSPDLNCSLSSKRNRLIAHRSVNTECCTSDDCMEVVKHSSPMCSSKSPCAVEGWLYKGFAGLSSSCSFFAI
ncbi:hypothetical protein PTKIN_Ptkin07bG0052500 [Pterospermum kingtungense]